MRPLPLWLQPSNLPPTTRFWLLFSLLLPPLLLLLYFYHSAVQLELEENRTFAGGIRQIQQLGTLQEHIAQYRGLHHGKQMLQQQTLGSERENSALLKELHQNINIELEELENSPFVDQNPIIFQSIVTLWHSLSPSSSLETSTSSFAAYSQLIQQIHQLMGEIADRSTPRVNPTYPERIEIYSLSIHSIPALKEQMGQLRGLTYGAFQQVQEINNNHHFRTLLPVLQTDIATSRQLIRNKLAHIYQHSPDTYQESFSFFSDYSIELAALQEALNWELENLQEGGRELAFFSSPNALFQQFSQQIELLDALTNALFTHVSDSLKLEQESIIKQRNRHLTLLLLLLLAALTTIHRTLRGEQAITPSLESDHPQLLALYKGVTESPATMVFITDLNGEMIYTNDALVERSGYSREELIGSSPKLLQSGETSTETYQRLWRHILQGNLWHGQISNRDRSGNLYWVDETITPILDHAGEVHAFLAIHIDITTQRMAEQRQQHQIEKLSALQSLLPSHSETEGSTTAAPPAEESVPPLPIRILAIDDEQTILDSYQALLKSRPTTATLPLNTLLGDTDPSQPPPSQSHPESYLLDCETSGERAIERLIQAVEAGTPYQVIYLDMLMPGGWDGIKTASEICRIDPDVRIIIVSAWSEHTPNELKSTLGNHFVYLTKPFIREELIQLTQYMAEDWRRTQQLTQSTRALARTMKELKARSQRRERELEHQQIYQMILATLSTSAPLYSGDRTAGHNEITQATLEALGVDRVTLWEIEEAGEATYLRASDCYNVQQQQHHQGARYAVSDYQGLWEQVQGRQVVRVDDTKIYTPVEGQQCYFEENQIGAVMMAPIFYNNTQLGIITAEVLGQPREWRLEEATFLSYVSNLVPVVEISAERRDAEQQAEMANRAKDDFLATMSHELRTPLTSMIGYGALLSDSPLNSEQRSLVNTMELAGKTLLALVNDILDISKIEAGKFELDHSPFNFNNLLHEVEMMFSPRASMNGIEFILEPPQQPVEVLLAGDERRIIQILINLIGNALKFTHSGSVTLRIRCEPSHQEESRTIARYHFDIIDTGIGIAPHVVDRLFKPFEQADGSISRNFGGTGLGLYISRVLAHLMSGDIQLQSVEQQGSTFTLSIPLEVTDLPIPPSSIWQQRENNTINAIRLQGRVLIVEDTLELQQLERHLVESSGAEVDTANDGEEGMALALANSYDLILMDMQMPKMDGITATQLLRASSVSTPIVALTANVMQQHRDQFHAAGCTDFLSKPIDRSALRQVLSTYLEVDQSAEGGPPSQNREYEISEELRTLFLERLQESLQQLESYSSSEAWGELQQLAHTLKGGGSSFGYPAVSQAAKALETALSEENQTQLALRIEQLQHCINEALTP